MKKYHSLAAKGEQVDIDELAKNEQTDANAEPAANDQKSLPSNGVATTHIIEQPQTAAGAQAAEHPAVTEPSIPATQATPAAAPNISAMGGAMPQALLNTGNYLRCRCSQSRRANDIHSTGRRLEEPHDELVLCWILYWLARRPAEGLCEHAGGRLSFRHHFRSMIPRGDRYT